MMEADNTIVYDKARFAPRGKNDYSTANPNALFGKAQNVTSCQSFIPHNIEDHLLNIALNPSKIAEAMAHIEKRFCADASAIIISDPTEAVPACLL